MTEFNDDLEEASKREPTAEEQAEFDEIYRNVLLAVDKPIVFNTPNSRQEFADALGGQDNVDKYYKMRMNLKVELKSRDDLGIPNKEEE